MKKYVGVRTERGGIVTVEDGTAAPRPLDPRTDLRNHSPEGFGWGYEGSGPAQLALALCADALGYAAADEDLVRDVYQGVKRRLVATLPEDQWTLSERDVLDAVQAVQRERIERLARPRAWPPIDGGDDSTPEAGDLPPPPGRHAPLVRRIDGHLKRLDGYRPADAADRELAAREHGWMEALRHLAAQDGLNHAGAVEADKVVAASEEWLRDLRTEPEGRIR
jgi:Family of unknown function (DUF6166)